MSYPTLLIDLALSGASLACGRSHGFSSGSGDGTGYGYGDGYGGGNKEIQWTA